MAGRVLGEYVGASNTIIVSRSGFASMTTPAVSEGDYMFIPYTGFPDSGTVNNDIAVDFGDYEAGGWVQIGAGAGGLGDFGNGYGLLYKVATASEPASYSLKAHAQNVVHAAILAYTPGDLDFGESWDPRITGPAGGGGGARLGIDVSPGHTDPVTYTFDSAGHVGGTSSGADEVYVGQAFIFPYVATRDITSSPAPLPAIGASVNFQARTQAIGAGASYPEFTFWHGDAAVFGDWGVADFPISGPDATQTFSSLFSPDTQLVFDGGAFRWDLYIYSPEDFVLDPDLSEGVSVPIESGARRVSIQELPYQVRSQMLRSKK